MGYTVKDLLESNNFSEMQLISDDSGIGREIKGVRIIEVPDMEKFLGGGVSCSLQVCEPMKPQRKMFFCII